MDRDRLIAKLLSKGLPTNEGSLKVIKTLGRGGNGVALLCTGEAVSEIVAKVYIPPDNRDLDDQSLGRFRNEVKLASMIRHPYVIPAIGSGAAQVGAYLLPYYLMPRAATTLRSSIGGSLDADRIQRVERLFLQACLGVSCLHAHGIVHRDLKPENVLVSHDGSAWIADLGIAHIDPDFVSVSLRTVAAERLLNRDYYAPEQRFGNPADVDARADIYALGCILYELFFGTPPVRRDSPPLASVSPAFGALDPVVNRMTSYDPGARYQNLESAIIDIALAFGWITATVRGARPPQPADLNEMTRLLRSSNGAKREAGIELAVGFGNEALPELHDLLGHGRREVRNAAALALGRICDERSISFLVAGLYGNSQKASTFRPTVDTAAEALSHYSAAARAQVARSLSQAIRPNQLRVLLQGVEIEAALGLIDELNARKLLLLDWAETPFDLMVELDEARTWARLNREALGLPVWTLARLFPNLSIEHQLNLARRWMSSNRRDAWDWDRMVSVITQIKAPSNELTPLISELERRLEHYPGRLQSKEQNLDVVAQRLRELSTE